MIERGEGRLQRMTGQVGAYVLGVSLHTIQWVQRSHRHLHTLSRYAHKQCNHVTVF
jgi:hypothetical protein